MKKHVLFIVENSAVPYDVRVTSEARAVKEMGYEVSIISPKGRNATKKYEVIEGMEVYRHHMPIEGKGTFGFFLEYFNAIFWELYLSTKIFIKKPFKIIHAANPPDHIFLIAWVFKLFGVKYIFDHHDVSPENYLAKFGNKGILYKMLLAMEWLTFKTANIVISTNESYARIAMNRGGKREENVFVVRNGPDLSRIQFLPPNDKYKNGFDHLVVYVGVIGNQEGIDNLLRSVHYIVYQKDVKTVKFMIVGTGTNWKDMVNLSEEMGLSEYVFFTGYVPYKEFYEILATADVCVNPEFSNSFTDKSTMIKIMDYMTFGKPIVMYETTEGKVTAGESAVYVKTNSEAEFAEALIRLLQDPVKKTEMGAIAKKRVETELNWEKQKYNLKRAYDYLENIGL